MRLGTAHGAVDDHVDERLDVTRGCDPQGRARRRRRRLAALDVDGAYLAGDVVELAPDLRAGVPPRLVEEDAIPPHGGEPEFRRVAADRVHAGTGGHEGAAASTPNGHPRRSSPIEHPTVANSTPRSPRSRGRPGSSAQRRYSM